MTLFDLTGKVAIVTGGSRGIGRAIAERLAEHGAQVVVASRKSEACEAAAAEINQRHGQGRAVAIAADLGSKASLQALVDAALARLGAIDILVCNAATSAHYGSMSTIADEQFRRTLENNILANHWLIQMTAPQMLARGEGSIIVVSSVGSMRGTASIGAYNISKAADLQLVRNLAVEFGPKGVRVNAIAPGLIRTNFSKALWTDEANLAQAKLATPLARLGEADEIAGAAVYLASKASSFTTGEVIVVDGGMTISGGGLG